MSQQEIDRLWDAHSHECNHSPEWDYVMDKEHFAQAAAEIRRLALEEAASHFDEAATRNDDAAERFRALCDENTAGEYFQYADEFRVIAKAIRALTQEVKQC